MRNNSQIATILTLIIGLIFLFMVFTINMGKVSKKKTVIDNACDGAGLLLASGLGSVASSLKFELGIFGDAPYPFNRHCGPNMNVIIGWALIIIGIATAIFTGGISTGIAFTLAAGLLTLAPEALYEHFTEPGLMREMQAKSQNMTAEQRLFEGAIQSAIFATVDDPKFVPDLFDVDRDGIKFPTQFDKITRFNHWYFQRLNSLPRLGTLIEKFYAYLFPNPAADSSGIPILGKQFEIKENPKTWDAEEAHLLVNGSWRIGDWLRDKLKPFVVELWNHGYGVEFAKDYTKDITVVIPPIWTEEQPMPEIELDDLGELYRDIRRFEDFIKKGVYGQSKDERIAAFEKWFVEFYNGSSSGQDWYKTMGEWVTHINTWIDQLTERHKQVLVCVKSCWAPGPYQCGFGGGPCCRSHCECWPCGDGALFHRDDVRAHFNWFRSDSKKVLLASGCGECCSCVCDAECGCNPAGRYNCELCASGHCRPAVPCNTPCNPPGCSEMPRPCCESGCFFFLPLCGDKIFTTSGGGGPCDGPCEDYYYDCGSPDDTIIRRDYITKLIELRDSLKAFQAEILDIYNESQKEKNDPWLRQAIYVWKDITGKETGQYANPVIQPQSAVHMVYVKLDLPADYKFPYPQTDRSWWNPLICQYVQNAKGDFYITVARYDEDLAKQGPLSNFWKFRFRRNPAKNEADLTMLRNAADRFSSKLDKGESCVNSCEGGKCTNQCFNSLVYPADFGTLSKFAYDNGIVAKVRVHYGPGYTYKREEIASGEAKKRNKDIYIMEKIR